MHFCKLKLLVKLSLQGISGSGWLFAGFAEVLNERVSGMSLE